METKEFLLKLQNKCENENLKLTITINDWFLNGVPSDTEIIRIYVSSKDSTYGMFVELAELNSLLEKDIKAEIDYKEQEKLLDKIREFGYIDTKFEDFFKTANRLPTPFADSEIHTK